jgi:hypothetical protein
VKARDGVGVAEAVGQVEETAETESVAVACMLALDCALDTALPLPTPLALPDALALAVPVPVAAPVTLAIADTTAEAVSVVCGLEMDAVQDGVDTRDSVAAADKLVRLLGEGHGEETVLCVTAAVLLVVTVADTVGVCTLEASADAVKDAVLPALTVPAVE